MHGRQGMPLSLCCNACNWSRRRLYMGDNKCFECVLRCRQLEQAQILHRTEEVPLIVSCDACSWSRHRCTQGV